MWQLVLCCLLRMVLFFPLHADVASTGKVTAQQAVQSVSRQRGEPGAPHVTLPAETTSSCP